MVEGSPAACQSLPSFWIHNCNESLWVMALVVGRYAALITIGCCFSVWGMRGYWALEESLWYYIVLTCCFAYILIRFLSSFCIAFHWKSYLSLYIWKGKIYGLDLWAWAMRLMSFSPEGAVLPDFFLSTRKEVLLKNNNNLVKAPRVPIQLL